MKNLTLEQVEELEKLQYQNRLMPLENVPSYYDEYSTEQIFLAQMALRFDYFKDLTKCNGYKHFFKQKMAKENEVLAKIKKQSKITNLSEVDFVRSLEKTNSLDFCFCYSNSIFIAMKAISRGHDAKIVSGIITCPTIADDEKEEPTVVSALHSVVQIGDNIYDHNYGVMMDKKEYQKLFAFNILAEANKQQIQEFRKVILGNKIKPAGDPKYNNYIYFVFAPNDFMKRIYGIDLDKKSEDEPAC